MSYKRIPPNTSIKILCYNLNTTTLLGVTLSHRKKNCHFSNFPHNFTCQIITSPEISSFTLANVPRYIIPVDLTEI